MLRCKVPTATSDAEKGPYNQPPPIWSIADLTALATWSLKSFGSKENQNPNES